MKQLLFCLLAIIAGGILHKIVSFLSPFIHKRKANKTEYPPVSISENHIQDCILPNNRGKSIDTIASKLISDQIDPDFSVDFSTQYGDDTQ